MKVSSLSDPCIKIALMIDSKRVKKKTFIKKVRPPYHIETFNFEFLFELIAKMSLVEIVVGCDQIGSDAIGKIAFWCATPSGFELRLWLDLLASPKDSSPSGTL